MQWDGSSAQAGFSTNPHTWLPVSPNYTTVNVQAELRDADSLLTWYRRLTSLLHTIPALSGRMVMLDVQNENVLSYARLADGGGSAVLVALNMSASPQTVCLDVTSAGVRDSKLKTLMMSPMSMERPIRSSRIRLPAFAAWMAIQ
jgi:alpha-glucosidase